MWQRIRISHKWSLQDCSARLNNNSSFKPQKNRTRTTQKFPPISVLIETFMQLPSYHQPRVSILAVIVTIMTSRDSYDLQQRVRIKITETKYYTSRDLVKNRKHEVNKYRE